MTNRNLQIRDRIDVERHGEELEVWNFLNVTPALQFRGGGVVREDFPDEYHIEAGGANGPVDYVTDWVANEIQHELNIDLTDDKWDVEVVNVGADAVTVL